MNKNSYPASLRCLHLFRVNLQSQNKSLEPPATSFELNQNPDNTITQLNHYLQLKLLMFVLYILEYSLQDSQHSTLAYFSTY